MFTTVFLGWIRRKLIWNYENKSLETFDFLFCIRCFCFKGVHNHVHNNIVYIYHTPYKVMHLLHAEKTTIIRKQYVWQGFMSFNILFPAGTSPADCNLPSENNKVMMSLSLQRIWIWNLYFLYLKKELTSTILYNVLITLSQS